MLPDLQDGLVPSRVVLPALLGCSNSVPQLQAPSQINNSWQAGNVSFALTQLMASAERSLGRSEAPDSSEGLKGPDSGDRIAQALKASFKDLDAQILAEEQKQGVEKGAFGGCTAVVALAMGDVSPSANSSVQCTVTCTGMVCCSVFRVQKYL